MMNDDDFIPLARPRDTPVAQAYRPLSDGLLARGEDEIRKAVERATGLALPNRRSDLLTALRESGHRFGVRLSPDGTEAFYVDDVLVLTFGPTELSVGEDNVATASRRVKHWGGA